MDQLPPPAREQHSTAVVHRDLYVYGGKTRVFETDSNGDPVFTHHSDIVHGDLWKLSVERARQYVLSYPNTTTTDTPIRSLVIQDTDGNNTIPQDSRLMVKISGYTNQSVSMHSDGVNPREGLCIDKAVVRVKLSHPCINQVKVSILGPGPISGSPNYFPLSDEHEVLLFSKLLTNGTGCAGGVHYFEFDDASTLLPEACCTDAFNDTYQPQGQLAEFVGTSMSADWTLVLQDVKEDNIQGSLLAWEIEFTASPCVERYEWTNLTHTTGTGAGAESPVPRYAAHAVAHQDSLFIYGGRDADDNVLSDLYRYDTVTETWTALTPVNFDIALSPGSSVGANFALTSWGLIRYGGYYRQPTIPEEYGNYDNSVAVQDPVTLRWRKIELADGSAAGGAVPLTRDSTFGRRGKPSERYLGATVFIPSHSLHWDTKYTHRNLYDDIIPSSRTNYQGSIADSLLMIGGFDGSTGSVFDGSSGGYLIDPWMLRLANWSTPGTRDVQQQYLERHCAWRDRISAVDGVSATQSCLGASGSSCEWRDLIMLPWCAMNNQSVF